MAILIIDMGTRNLKFSLFDDKDGLDLIKTKAIQIGILNENTMARELAKGYQAMAGLASINNTVIIPGRANTNSMSEVFPELEYYDNNKDMNNRIVREIYSRIVSERNKTVKDWIVQEDNSLQNYKNVFASAMMESYYASLVKIAKASGIKKYMITKPQANITNLIKNDDKVYLTIDFGHLYTEINVIGHGKVHAIRVIDQGGDQITKELQDFNKDTVEESERYKHSLTLQELDASGCNKTVAEVLKACHEIVLNVKTAFGIVPTHMYLFGGTANLAGLEEHYTKDLDLIPINPPLQVNNFREVKREETPFLVNSVGVATDLVNKKSMVNFSAPKSSLLGANLDLINKIKSFLVIPTAAIIGISVGLAGAAYIQNQGLSEKLAAQKSFLSNYESKVTSTQTTIDSKKKELLQILDNNPTSSREVYDWEILLEQFAALVPVGVSIKSIESPMGDTFIITGYSDTYDKASTMAILLRSKLFMGANIDSLTTQENIDGTPVYEFVIRASKRRI